MAGNSCGVKSHGEGQGQRERIEDRAGQVDVNGKDGDYQDQRHFHQEIAELPDAVFESPFPAA